MKWDSPHRTTRLTRSPPPDAIFSSDLFLAVFTLFSFVVLAGRSPFGSENETAAFGILGGADGVRSVSFVVSYQCERNFILLDRWTLLARPLDGVDVNAAQASMTPFAALTIAWEKTCRKPSCAEACDEHGQCNRLFGICECDADYYGINCELQVVTPTLSVCPGTNLSLSFHVPGRAGADSDWFAFYEAGFIDATLMINWRYFKYLSQIWRGTYDGGADIVGSFAEPMDLGVQPGDYELVFYYKDSYVESGRKRFTVKSYAECGLVAADAEPCGAANRCSAHGECVAVAADARRCNCTAPWFVAPDAHCRVD